MLDSPHLDMDMGIGHFILDLNHDFFPQNRRVEHLETILDLTWVLKSE